LAEEEAGDAFVAETDDPASTEENLPKEGGRRETDVLSSAGFPKWSNQNTRLGEK
jgi:hypothetical protein